MDTQKKNTILVPVDFSDIAMHALNHAVEVAKHFNNNIALLYVIEEAFLSGLLSFGKHDQKEDLAKEAATGRLEKIAKDLKEKNGISCSVHVRSGKIYKEIAAAAADLGCDSVIMGSNGASGIEQLIGSNASRTILHSKVPVVVVKSNQHDNRYKQIVFPLDLSVESKQKVKWAIHLGKSYNATINILTFKVKDEFLANRIVGSLHQIERMLDEEGVKHTSEMLDRMDDDFAMETIKYAEKINADLVMIMTNSEEKDLNEYIIGTYAQQIVNKSEKIPVMCINPVKTGLSGNWSY